MRAGLFSLVTKQRARAIMVCKPTNGEKLMNTPMANDNDICLVVPSREASLTRICLILLMDEVRILSVLPAARGKIPANFLPAAG